MTLHTYSRRTDISVQIVTRSYGGQRTLFHENLHIVISRQLAGWKMGIRIPRRNHEVVGTIRFLLHKLAEETQRLTKVLNRRIP